MGVGAVCLLAGTALALSSRIAPYASRALSGTIVVVGLLLMVVAIYVLMVIGLGRTPEDGERGVLVLSMAAAALAAVLAAPARHRLEAFAARQVVGLGRSPEEALKTFSGRMTRAVPMDELLLQLVESLRSTLALTGAEMWTGSAGRMIRAVSRPDLGDGRMDLTDEERVVVARARVQGNAWIQVWMPVLLEGRDDRVVRVAVATHLGELLGLIVVERAADGPSFDEEEDRVLSELSRQVGLALHNMRLDSALQDSLEELEIRNRQLQASQLRIVTAADESRRRIERDLHDGAQQHLVALAVKVGLAKTLLESDPATSQQLLGELRGDVQATLTELRDLAHGIYPPLLRDRGITEALRTAANRALLPTTVNADGVPRYDSEIEAAVYFCCLEALQNAGKYAGERAAIVVSVGFTTDALWFEVRDDGSGFDAEMANTGHGFVNMRDRLGAFGGTLQVESIVGEGTVVRGTLPLHRPSDPETVDSLT
ncbi:MAG: histidine kinase [Acidimicrobiales bacterium]